MKVNPVLLLLLALTLALTSAGCGNGEDDFIQDPNVLDSQQYLPETVYIGAILPLDSGERAAARYAAAQEVAADIINNSHQLEWELAQSPGLPGYGAAQVELVRSDNSVDPANPSHARTGEATDELVQLGVSALLGAFSSEATAIAANRARSGETPLVAGAVHGGRLTDGLTYRFGPWFNRIAATAGQQSQLFFAYVKFLNQTQGLSISRVALVYENSKLGLETLEAFNAAAEEYDFEVCGRIIFEPEAANVAAEAQRLIATAPDAVFHLGAAQQLGLFASTYDAAQFQPQAALAYGSAIQQRELSSVLRQLELEMWAGYSICPAPLVGEEEWDNPELAIFHYIDDLYRRKTGRGLDNDSLAEYAALTVVAQAISLCGSTDPELLAAALRDNSFPAPYLAAGAVDFDEQGQNSLAAGFVAGLGEDGLVELFSTL